MSDNTRYSRRKIGSVRVNVRSAFEELLGSFLRANHNDFLLEHTDHKDIAYCHEISITVDKMEREQTITRRPVGVSQPRCFLVNTEKVPNDGKRTRPRRKGTTSGYPSPAIEYSESGNYRHTHRHYSQ